MIAVPTTTLSLYVSQYIQCFSGSFAGLVPSLADLHKYLLDYLQKLKPVSLYIQVVTSSVFSRIFDSSYVLSCGHDFKLAV